MLFAQTTFVCFGQVTQSTRGELCKFKCKNEISRRRWFIYGGRASVLNLCCFGFITCHLSLVVAESGGQSGSICYLGLSRYLSLAFPRKSHLGEGKKHPWRNADCCIWSLFISIGAVFHITLFDESSGCVYLLCAALKFASFLLTEIKMVLWQ
jgi:hypothetical protein